MDCWLVKTRHLNQSSEIVMILFYTILLHFMWVSGWQVRLSISGLAVQSLP